MALNPQGYNYEDAPLNNNPFWEDETISTLGATVQVDSNVGTPYATVANRYDSEHERYVLDFSFHNLKGETGAQGPQGIQGIQGIQGEQGEKGETGATGAQGPQGPQGPAGPQGLQGPQGIKGETGLQGPQGPAGATGAQGLPGQNGVGVPTGGTVGQILAKVSADNYDTEWIDPPEGGGGGEETPWSDVTFTNLAFTAKLRYETYGWTDSGGSLSYIDIGVPTWVTVPSSYFSHSIGSTTTKGKVVNHREYDDIGTPGTRYVEDQILVVFDPDNMVSIFDFEFDALYFRIFANPVSVQQHLTTPSGKSIYLEQVKTHLVAMMVQRTDKYVDDVYAETTTKARVLHDPENNNLYTIENLSATMDNITLS